MGSPRRRGREFPQQARALHGHDRARSAGGGGYVTNPKGYGIKAFALGSSGQVKPTQIQNPAGVNVTAYCVSGAGVDYVTVINKAHGADAGDADVTIVTPGMGVQNAEIMTLAGGQPGRRPGEQCHARRRQDQWRHPLGGHMEYPARRSGRRNQPDRQGHDRRHRQDP